MQNPTSAEAVPMLQNILNRITTFGKNITSRAIRGRNWRPRAAFYALLVSLFFNMPRLDTFLWQMDINSPWNSWETTLRKSQDLLYDPATNHPLVSNDAKHLWRLTVPFMIRVLGLTIPGMVAFQMLCGFVMLYLSVTLAFQITADRRAAFWLTITLGCTIAGLASFAWVDGHFDGIAVMLMLLACLSTHPVVIGSLVFSLTWFDERGAIAAAVILLCHVTRTATDNRWSWRTVIQWRSVAVIVACALHLSLRVALAEANGLPLARTDGATLALVAQQASAYLFVTVSGAFEGGWLIVAGGVLILIASRNWLLGLAYIGLIVATFALSLYVYDVSRTIIYLIPLLYSALMIIKRSHSEAYLQRMILSAFAISAIFPTLLIQGQLIFYEPLPFYLLGYFGSNFLLRFVPV